jgi:hypothetical protein
MLVLASFNEFLHHPGRIIAYMRSDFRAPGKLISSIVKYSTKTDFSSNYIEVYGIQCHPSNPNLRFRLPYVLCNFWKFHNLAVTCSFRAM